MMRFFAYAFVLALACTASARASMLTHTDTIPLQFTDWTLTATVPQFDPALGTLDSVEFTLKGDILGTVFYENQEPTPSDVSLMLSAILNLYRPDNSALLSVSPALSIVETANPYDSTLDFGGDSGRTYTDLAATLSDSYTTIPMEDLSPYIGLGNLIMPADAFGNSSGSGPGNWTFGFLTQAEAKVTVTYHYTPIPEPATLVCAFVGAWQLLFVRRITIPTVE